MSKKTRIGIIKNKLSLWSVKRQAERLNKLLIQEYLEVTATIPEGSYDFWTQGENSLLLQALKAREENL